MEPFTGRYFKLQEKFNQPNELFHSIPDSWRRCTNDPADVRELTPEFFCNPVFLRNENSLEFRSQDGIPVVDVALPPWARNSADEFIRINRLALESEYVSQNLHHWIDLIFGYKQRGVEALKALNREYFPFWFYIFEEISLLNSGGEGRIRIGDRRGEGEGEGRGVGEVLIPISIPLLDLRRSCGFKSD
jgi:hypothetical protein